MVLIATAAVLTGGSPDVSARGLAVPMSDAPEGGWSWFADPRAVQHEGVLYFGYVRGTDGSVMVATWDGTTLSETVIASELQVNDHAYPSLLIRASDERIIAFYTKHLDTTVRYRVSTNPLDISEWGAEQTVGNKVAGQYTYTMPVQLSGEYGQPIRLFYRVHVTDDGGDQELSYSKSDDDGATWGSGVRLSDLNYTKVAANGTRIHFFGTQHPDSGQTSLYHFYFDSPSGEWRKSDGTALVSPSFPLQTSDMTLVYDGSTTRAWVWDAAMDGDYPVVAFATFPGNDGSDHRANVARWDGDSWGVDEIAQMGADIHPGEQPEGNGQIFYSGGIAIDRGDPRIVYVSRQVGSDWHIFRYPGAVQLTSGSVKHIRPVAVHAPGRFRALAMAGTYTSYVDFSVGTIAIPR